MNIERKNIDEVSAVVTLKIDKADYSERVEKSMKTVRQRANVPGFRPGKVPAALIDKMYRKSVIAEEVNKLIPEKLYEYLKENKIEALGEPMPSENQELIDFDKQEEFVISFDVALKPEVNINLGKDITLPQYEIKVDDEMLEGTIKNYTARYGEYTEVDDVVAEDVVKGNVVELENGVAKEGGIKVEGAVFSPRYMKEDAKKAVVGAKKGSTITINPKTAMENEAEIASFLKIKKEDAANVTSDFSFEITGITRYKEAELNQELFDKALGEGKVKSEEEFRNLIKDELKEGLQADSDFRLLIDAKEVLTKQIENVKFADKFLRRQIMASNKELTEDKLDETYPKEIESFRWLLAKSKVLKDNDVKIGEQDLINFAKKVAKTQFAQYGMVAVPEDVLENYAKQMLENKEQVNQILDNVNDEKFVEILKKSVTLEKKEVTIKEFNELFANKEA